MRKRLGSLPAEPGAGCRAPPRPARSISPASASRAIVDGAPALVWAPGGLHRAVIGFTITGGKITEINLIGGPRAHAPAQQRAPR